MIVSSAAAALAIMATPEGHLYSDLAVYREETLKREETRWALLVKTRDRSFFAGRFCWPGASQDDPVIRTFRTRALAREGRKTCCYSDGKPTKVRVTITKEIE